MKSQDIVLLFKLASLHVQALNEIPSVDSGAYTRGLDHLHPGHTGIATHQMPEVSLESVQGERYPDWGLFGSHDLDSTDFSDWQGWQSEALGQQPIAWADQYSGRALSLSLGISKSEVSNSMVRCRESGLVIDDYETRLPKVNRRELLKIAESALKYFFPVKPGAIVRGIPTGFAAPALAKSLKSAGDLIPVWPDPLGSQKGQTIEPLYKSVPYAVKRDRTLYHYLALVDAIRVGGPRESSVAVEMLRNGLGLP